MKQVDFAKANYAEYLRNQPKYREADRIGMCVWIAALAIAAAALVYVIVEVRP